MNQIIYNTNIVKHGVCQFVNGYSRPGRADDFAPITTALSNSKVPFPYQYRLILYKPFRYKDNTVSWQ